LDDANLLLSWRNSSNTRRFSGHTALIPSDDHFKWFIARLDRAQVEPFFIFQSDLEPIGMSRLDLVNGSVNQFEISIMVDPKHSGKRLGSRILEMTCNSLLNLMFDFSIAAKVHPNNIVSQKLFTSAGFDLVSSRDIFLHFEKKFRST
jgi:RimJ/RimL family protein N-acetyltransferase